MPMITLQYEDGSFVSRFLVMTQEGLKNTSGVNIMEAMLFPNEEIAKRCLYTLEDKGYKSKIYLYQFSEDELQFLNLNINIEIDSLKNRSSILLNELQSICDHTNIIYNDFIEHSLICKSCNLVIETQSNPYTKSYIQKKYSNKIIFNDLGEKINIESDYFV